MQENKKTKETTTEVTSIKDQEEKSGQEINVPSAEELVARASSSMIVNKKLLGELLFAKTGSKYKLSRKALARAIIAILDMPTDGIPVTLKSDDEKLAFGLGQKMIADRFILTQNHISQEMKKRQQAKESEELKSEEQTTEGGTNE